MHGHYLSTSKLFSETTSITAVNQLFEEVLHESNFLHLSSLMYTINVYPCRSRVGKLVVNKVVSWTQLQNGRIRSINSSQSLKRSRNSVPIFNLQPA